MLESRIESAAFTKISCASRSSSRSDFERKLTIDSSLTVDEADPSGSGPIKVGDVVEVARSNIEKGQERKSSAGYLGVVEEIRRVRICHNGIPHEPADSKRRRCL